MFRAAILFGCSQSYAWPPESDGCKCDSLREKPHKSDRILFTPTYSKAHLLMRIVLKTTEVGFEPTTFPEFQVLSQGAIYPIELLGHKARAKSRDSGFGGG